MSPIYMGSYELTRQDPDEGKSRAACAQRGCVRGPSVGYTLTFVSKPGEPRVGYCDEHLEGHREPSPR